MCQIAGYVGPKRAAPILLQMLERQERFDGYMATGITTVSNGELLCDKVVGNVDVLRKTTDAESFGGNIGIAHSRSNCRNGNGYSHPFWDEDKNISCCLNGAHSDCVCDEWKDNVRKIVDFVENSGKRFLSEHVVENPTFPLKNGKAFHSTELRALNMQTLFENGMSISEAFAKDFSQSPNDKAMAMIHKSTPDRFYVCRIARPLVAAICEDETYVATTRFAFPDDIKPKSVITIPVNTVCEIYAGGVNITPYKVTSADTEDISVSVYKKAYELVCDFITGAEDKKYYFDIIEDKFYREWRFLWNEPYIDSKFAAKDGLLKPYAHLLYEILYDLHKNGLLKMKSEIVSNRSKTEMRTRYVFWI